MVPCPVDTRSNRRHIQPWPSSPGHEVNLARMLARWRNVILRRIPWVDMRILGQDWTKGSPVGTQLKRRFKRVAPKAAVAAPIQRWDHQNTTTATRTPP